MATLGQDLKKERESRQISLREIADATKISRRFFEAIEKDEFEVLPGGVYDVGFVRQYVRHIGLNEQEIVDRFRDELQRRDLERSDTIRPRSVTFFQGLPRQGAVALISIAVFLVVSVTVVYFIWFR